MFTGHKTNDNPSKMASKRILETKVKPTSPKTNLILLCCRQNIFLCLTCCFLSISLCVYVPSSKNLAYCRSTQSSRPTLHLQRQWDQHPSKWEPSSYMYVRSDRWKKNPLYESKRFSNCFASQGCVFTHVPPLPSVYLLEPQSEVIFHHKSEESLACPESGMQIQLDFQAQLWKKLLRLAWKKCPFKELIKLNDGTNSNSSADPLLNNKEHS